MPPSPGLFPETDGSIRLKGAAWRHDRKEIDASHDRAPMLAMALSSDRVKTTYSAMCNRIRGLKEWRDIPRALAGQLINFEYNPNVAPTEQVPAFIAERGKPVVAKLARFGINLPTREREKDVRRCLTPEPTACDGGHSKPCWLTAAA